MARDYFVILGLTPGRHDPQEIARRFVAQRDRLTAQLLDPSSYAESRRRLDELHLAYATLRDPQRQQEYLRTRDGDNDRVAELRGLILAALENGLLRYSRRQAILQRAQELGFNEFQTQLIIAQVQFGDDEIAATPGLTPLRRATPNPRAWAQVAATGVLALAMFLFLVHWVGS